MQAAVTKPDVAVVTCREPARTRAGAVRRAEWILFAFLVYAPVLAVLMRGPGALAARLSLANSAVLLAYAAAIGFDAARPRLALGVARDWAPLALVLLAYREMGWFALPHTGHVLESHWVVWDRLFLNGGGRVLIECLGPAMPAVLEIAYALVYALPPFAVAMLYVYGRRDRVDRFLPVFLLSVLLCYGQFPFWPSEPPRVVFFGQDLPAYLTVFRRFNLWMLGSYGIHTSVFPSAHVAGALAAALGVRMAMPERKWVYRLLFVMASLIALATVYGRYHYMADAICGALVASGVAGVWWMASASLRHR